ncbi:MAG: WbuC family cupin fold metalloprotein [Gammaproteobacteria bacterium]|nr:WbuC family cupin fold metalloprotein [Gammaproteobacteria bacterium]
MTIQRFSDDYLASLIDEASRSARSRQHRNIHVSYDDPCQRFMNAIGMESYIRPHRHAIDPKSETLIAVRGKFALFIFDDNGAIQEIISFGTERYADASALSVGVDLAPGVWHTIVALQPGSVLLELKAGPFNSNGAKEPAPWAPEEQTSEANEYLQYLRSAVANRAL